MQIRVYNQVRYHRLNILFSTHFNRIAIICQDGGQTVDLGDNIIRPSLKTFLLANKKLKPDANLGISKWDIPNYTFCLTTNVKTIVIICQDGGQAVDLGDKIIRPSLKTFLLANQKLKSDANLGISKWDIPDYTFCLTTNVKTIVFICQDGGQTVDLGD